MKYLLPIIAILSFLSCNNEKEHGIDYHVHIQSPEMAKQMEKFGDTINSSDRYYIDSSLENTIFNRAVIMSMGYMASMPDLNLDYETQKKLTRDENQFVINQANQSEKLYAFFSVNPLTDYAKEEANYWIKEGGINGLKLHLANSDFDFFNAVHIQKLQSLLEIVDDTEMNIFIHLRNRNPDYGPEDVDVFMNEILPFAPNSTWILAHAGGWGGFDEATDKVLSKFIDAIQSGKIEKERIYLDIAAVILPGELKTKFQIPEEVLKEQEANFIKKFRSLETGYWLFGSDWLPNATGSSNQYFNELIEAGFNKEELQIISGNRLSFVK